IVDLVDGNAVMTTEDDKKQTESLKGLFFALQIVYWVFVVLSAIHTPYKLAFIALFVMGISNELLHTFIVKKKEQYIVMKRIDSAISLLILLGVIVLDLL